MLGYRAHFEVADRESVLAASMDEFRSWLRGKGYDPDSIIEGSSSEIAPNVEASLTAIGASGTVRAQVIERKPEGTWTSELTVYIPADRAEPAAVLLDIHSPPTDDSQPISTGVPRLARGLLGTLGAQDSLARLTDQPILTRTSEVDALAAAIRDPNRRGLLFVAGSADSLPLRAWSKYVATLLRQTVGLASAYVLDADATRELATMLGPTHAVAPGTLRTYLPGVDPSSQLDARRHRILSTTRIVNDRSQWIAGILGRRARENALEVELPPSLQNVVDQIAARSDEALLGRSSITQTVTETALETGVGEDDELTEVDRTLPEVLPEVVEEIEADTPAESTPTVAGPSETEATATPVPEVTPARISESDESYLAAVAAIHEVLGVSDATPEDWAELGALARLGRQAEQNQKDVAIRLEELRAEVGQVSLERRNLARRLEDEQLEHAATYANVADSENELRRLRTLLLQTEQASVVYSFPEGAVENEAPGSFVELVANLPDLPGIEFTGDESVAVRLDVQDPLGLWATKAWAVLEALSDYAQASVSGRCDRDVHGYLLDLPDGCRGYSTNKHAAGESEDVQKNPKFAEARTFPVPSLVEATGKIAMMAHFKVAQSGLISPRIHYYDDVRRTGKVYVGYIGPHLPTKRTN